MALTDDDKRDIRAMIYDMMQIARCVDFVEPDTLAVMDSQTLRALTLGSTKMPLRSPRRR